MESKRERLRRRYRPPMVRLLFIGESPPASARFFYQRDSGLYRAIRDAFRGIDPSIADEGFLTDFQNRGCYLIDTCTDPVDRLDPKSRRAACVAGEHSLSRSISRLQPSSIVTLLRSIQNNVRRAVALAGWSGPILEVPYPGRWARHREVFVRALVPHLRDLLGADEKVAQEPRLNPPAGSARRYGECEEGCAGLQARTKGWGLMARQLGKAGVTVVLAARDPNQGEAEVRKLREGA
jgi:hypothetical protein